MCFPRLKDLDFPTKAQENDISSPKNRSLGVDFFFQLVKIYQKLEDFALNTLIVGIINLHCGKRYGFSYHIKYPNHRLKIVLKSS